MNIKSLYLEDQTDRKNLFKAGNLKLLSENDKRRKYKLQKILKIKKKLSAEELYFAAFIFHHGQLKIDSKEAISLSSKSLALGYKKAGWIYAASVDRLCMKEKKPQKYGTQYYRKNSTSKFELYKVDKNVKDEERLRLGVPVLKEAKKNVKKINTAK